MSLVASTESNIPRWERLIGALSVPLSQGIPVSADAYQGEHVIELETKWEAADARCDLS